jgi:hypothetical protein
MLLGANAKDEHTKAGECLREHDRMTIAAIVAQRVARGISMSSYTYAVKRLVPQLEKTSGLRTIDDDHGVPVALDAARVQRTSRQPQHGGK